MRQILSSLLFILLIIPLYSFLSDKDVFIEIKDRQKLPTELYASLKDYNAILIGEIHGNNETPEFVMGLTNLWLTSGEKVLLGLEINQDEQSSIDQFLKTGDSTIIKKMKFFNRSFQDGRSSVAIANLIKSFYKKDNFKLICIDQSSTNTNTMKRDSVMASNAFMAMKSNPTWKFISLTGNVHNKTELGPFGYPMGYWLVTLLNTNLKETTVTSIDITYESGTCWNCTPECQVHRQGNSSGELAEKYTQDNFFIISGQKKYFFTRQVSAALPLNN